METLPRIGEQLSDSSSATNHRLSTAERDFKAAFRAAALSITNLYKGGLGTSKKGENLLLISFRRDAAYHVLI